MAATGSFFPVALGSLLLCPTGAGGEHWHPARCAAQLAASFNLLGKGTLPVGAEL